MDKETFIGNLTTILKILIMTIAPPIAVYLGLDQQTVLAFLTACMTFIIAITDAKYFNTFFNNNEPTITVNVETTELEKAIQEATDETSTQTETVVEEDDQQ